MALIRLVVERDGGRCCRCGELGSDSADHYPVPRCMLSPGEWYNPARLHAAHLACNVQAGAKLGAARLAEKRMRNAQTLGWSREW